MGIRERNIERYIRDRLKLELPTSMMEKWGSNGNPDDVVFYNGQSYFLEVKTTDGSPQSNQVRQIQRIKETGNNVFLIKGYKEADWFIEMLKRINVNPTTP